MQRIIILGHENPDVDSIVSGYLLEKIMKSSGYNAEFIIPDEKIETETVNLCKKYGLDPTKYMKRIDLGDKNNNYILVDHNERKVAGKIMYIIDHHPTSRNRNEEMCNKRISSTACLLSQGREDLLNENDLRLAVVATLLDTASFHSTKSRDIDKEWVLKICNKYNFDYQDLYKEGLCLTPLDDLNVACFNGLKRYYFDNLKVESSFIQINGIDGDFLYETIDIIKKHMKEENLDAFVFITHNMELFNTTYYLITDKNIIIKKYSEYTSRGNTIMPEIEKKLLLNK